MVKPELIIMMQIVIIINFIPCHMENATMQSESWQVFVHTGILW